jgi:hypothetical protein
MFLMPATLHLLLFHLMEMCSNVCLACIVCLHQVTQLPGSEIVGQL